MILVAEFGLGIFVIQLINVCQSRGFFVILHNMTEPVELNDDARAQCFSCMVNESLNAFSDLGP